MPQHAEGFPAWVSDGSIRKYHRAVESLRKQRNTTPSEAEIKDLYVKSGGLVLESAEEVPAEEPKKTRKK